MECNQQQVCFDQQKKGLSSGELESCAKMEVNKNATIGDSGRLGDCQLLDTKT
jgi:hypothetical protein